MRRLLITFVTLSACNAILGNEPRDRYEPVPVAAGAAGAAGADQTMPAAGLGGVLGVGGESGAGHGGDPGAAGAAGAPDEAGGAAGASGSAGAGGGAGESCIAGETTPELCSAKVVYVSEETGDDTYNGCSPCSPKQSIGAALSALAELASGEELSGFTVRVCSGVYEGLSLQQPVSLEGGYDCTTWQRTPDYGYPTFDALNETTLVNPSVQGATLVIDEAAVDADTHVDGFRIQGREDGNLYGTVALSISSGASPLISNNRITGGSGVNEIFGSVGIWIEGDSSPEIELNSIDGGSGVGLSVGSAALVVPGDASAPHIHDNQIDGGSGHALERGSVGIYLASSGALTIERNVVSGGSGLQDSPLQSGRSATAAVWLSGSGSYTVSANHIDGGTSADDSTMGLAVYSKASGEITIVRNRIYGGELQAEDAQTRGIFIDGSQYVVIANNMIHGGRGFHYAFGVFLLNAGFTKLAFNTVFAGVVDNLSPFINAAVMLNASIGTTLRGNILSGWADEPAFGVYSTLCETEYPFAKFENNLVFGGPNGVLGFTNTSCISTQIGSMEMAETRINTCLADMPDPGPCEENGGSSAKDNITIKASCMSDTRCLTEAACTLTDGSTSDCLTTVFSSFNAGDLGRTELFADGWLLAPGGVCDYVAYGVPAVTPEDPDLFEHERTGDYYSMGAHEFELCD